MKNWYSMKVNVIKNATSEGEINIYDEIGMWGIDAKAFKNDFDKIKNLSKIKVSINSPGGSVFDGIAIYNLLNEHKSKVETEVIGIAASIASVIAMAGNKRTMRQGTHLMVHNAWTLAVGDAKELRKQADTLDKITDSIVNIYSTNGTINESEIRGLLDEETWMNPTDAKNYGFITDVEEGQRIAASFNKPLMNYGYSKIPDGLPIGVPNADKTTNKELVYEEEIKALQEKILKFKIDNRLK